jgi:hypothetical protein
MAAIRLLTRTRWRLVLLMGVIGMAGIGVGFMLPAPAPANPSVRRSAPPEAFKSGSQLSVPVLKEMAQTLQRIDSRLQRIEQAVLDAARTQTSRPATSEGR